MIFKRREKRSMGEKLRDLVQPRKGWRRGVKYIGRRVQRLPDTPHRIAIGFACGAAASFTPFFTLHALVAVVLAWAVRGNIIAGVFGTAVGNPVTFPFIATTCMQTGYWLLGLSGDTEAATQTKLSFSYLTEHPLDFFVSIFTPYLVGGIAPGLLCGLGFYIALRPIVAGFQNRRRQVLAKRARDRVGEAKRGQSKPSSESAVGELSKSREIDGDAQEDGPIAVAAQAAARVSRSIDRRDNGKSEDDVARPRRPH